MKDLSASDLHDLLPLPHGPQGPGCATAVIKDGQVVAMQCKGMASVEHQVPITPQTVFRVASITKQFLCAGLVALADEGRLDLDAPLGDFVALKPGPARVALRQAMSNTSGIRDHLELWFMAGGGLQNPHRLPSSLDLCARQEALNFPPGTRYLYSNANFLLLSQVVETVTGQPLGDFLQARFFDPLGMTRTRLRSGHFDVIPDLATGYIVDEAGALKRGRLTTELWGEGAAHSCLDDLVKWVCYYRTDPDGIIARMKAPMPIGAGHAPYGLGLFSEAYNDASNIVHTGLWPGYLTEVLYRPSDDLGLVTLANDNAIEPTQVNRALLERVSPQDTAPPPKDWSDAAWQAAMEEGLWIAPDTLDVAEFKSGPDGEFRFVTYGFWTAMRPAPGACLVPTFTRSDYTGVDLSRADAGVVEITLANGTRLQLRPAREVYADASPDDFAGTWWSDELQSTLIIRRDGAGFVVETPGFRGHDWMCTALSGGVLQIEVNGGPWPRKFFVILEAGSDMLVLNGPRVRRMSYVRA